MSDMISRSELLKLFPLDMENPIWHFTGIRAAIEAAPTIDAVPVVRCKDCKHWGMLEGPPETESVKCCEFGQYMVGANGYCVYGEVKDND